MKERVVFPKPRPEEIAQVYGAQTRAAKGYGRTDVIVVKFREGTRIRQISGQLIFDENVLSPFDQTLMERAALNQEKVKTELEQVKQIVEGNAEIIVEPLFKRPAEVLDQEKEFGQTMTGEELADANLYYHVYTKSYDPAKAEELLKQLNALDIVEVAYPQPLSEPASVDIAPLTNEFTSRQEYL